MRRFAAFSVAFALAACVTDVVRAAEPFAKVGFYGATWLQFPVGIRNIGMGATGTSDVSGLATGHFNPATAAWTDATIVTGSYESFNVPALGMTLSEFQVISPIPVHSDSADGNWRFSSGLAYTRQGMDPQIERTIFLPGGTGRTIDLDSWMISALGASQWTHGGIALGGGGAAKYINENRGAEDLTTWSFDVGMIASYSFLVRGSLIRPRAGYAALNLDAGGSFDDREYSIATEKRAGFGLDLAAPPVTVFGQAVSSVSLALDHDRIDAETGAFSSPPDYATGVELSLVDLVHIRYGVLHDSYTMYGAGVGWDYGRVLFSLDYAHSRPEDSFYRDFFNLERDTFGALMGVRW